MEVADEFLPVLARLAEAGVLQVRWPDGTVKSLYAVRTLSIEGRVVFDAI
jgi:hypothetical protein